MHRCVAGLLSGTIRSQFLTPILCRARDRAHDHLDEVRYFWRVFVRWSESIRFGPAKQLSRFNGVPPLRGDEHVVDTIRDGKTAVCLGQAAASLGDFYLDDRPEPLDGGRASLQDHIFRS